MVLSPWVGGQMTDEGEGEVIMTGSFGLSEWIMLPSRKTT